MPSIALLLPRVKSLDYNTFGIAVENLDMEMRMSTHAMRSATMPAGGPPVIVNHLSRLMGERRVSITRVAREAGMAYSAVHELYHDRTSRYDRETLNKLCTYFKVPVGAILEWVPDDGAEGAA
jgi:putative transcriptional regulator